MSKNLNNFQQLPDSTGFAKWVSLPKYKQNLHITITGDVYDDILSYTTIVGGIDHLNSIVTIYGYWSVTTSKHINYVAEQLDYKVVDVHDVEMDLKS